MQRQAQKVWDSLLFSLGSRYVKRAGQTTHRMKETQEAYQNSDSCANGCPMNMLPQAFTCIHFSFGMFWFLSLDQEPFKITFRNNFELPSLKLRYLPLKMDGCFRCFISGGLAYQVRTGNSLPSRASVSSVPTVRLGTSHAKPPWYKALARQDCWTTKIDLKNIVKYNTKII